MCKFKIGDRVRLVEPYARLDAGAEGFVTGFWEEGVDVEVNGVDHGCFYHRVELVPAFTLEPGKFYRTRDGRKVGPMCDNGDTAWNDDERCLAAGIDGSCKLFRVTSGKHLFDDETLDLIAEWVDEPTAPIAALVDAIAEEYGPVVAASGPKFKVGDRVVALEDSWTSVRKGSIYTVVEVLDEAIRFRKADGTIDGWGQKFFALFSPAPVTAIVALIEDGQPKPADRPYVHTSEEAAATEAKRLASIHKGKQFGVFVLTTTAEEAKPTYSHEWQRLAADGQKIAAIKELRSLTGMMLKPAKDVVEHFIDGPYSLAA